MNGCPAPMICKVKNSISNQKQMLEDYAKRNGFPNPTHFTDEAIINEETFDNVQRIRGNVKRYPDGWGEAYPLTSLMYCADCGGKMYVHRTYNGKRIPQYTCSQYTKVPCGA